MLDRMFEQGPGCDERRADDKKQAPDENARLAPSLNGLDIDPDRQASSGGEEPDKAGLAGLETLSEGSSGIIAPPPQPDDP